MSNEGKYCIVDGMEKYLQSIFFMNEFHVLVVYVQQLA